MEKVKFTVHLKGNEEDYHYQGKGILRDGLLHYFEDQVKVTISTKEPIYLKREQEDYLLQLNFEEKKIKQGTYYLNQWKKSIPLSTKTKKIEKKMGRIEIIYDLILDQESSQYQFLLEYEVQK